MKLLSTGNPKILKGLKQGVRPKEIGYFSFTKKAALEAARQRRKLTELETAAFSGQTGMAGGALARDRAGSF